MSVSRRRAALALVALACVLGFLLARRGTAQARAGAAAGIGAGIALVLAWGTSDRRRLSDPAAVLRGPGRSVDRARAERALRALSLVGPEGEATEPGTSAELARLHVARSLADLPAERILERGSRVAARVGAGALVASVGVLAVTLAKGWTVVEGGDVLFARGGVAPVALGWLDAMELDARPPEYLHQGEIHASPAATPLLLRSALPVPYGTVVTLRGRALRPGRRLLLSDGVAEVPFTDDGAGAVVARWEVAQSTTLRVVARFGDVVIPEPTEISITSIPDLPPVVTLDGAPRRVILANETEDIALRYEAVDDHGLREVRLVLRSGAREDRRSLSHLDGETTKDVGGHSLRLRDPFLRKSHAPIEVTVEARDNDPLKGLNWGVSAAITVIPPAVGEPEARRLDALRVLRSQLVEELAWRLKSEVPVHGGAARSSLLAEDRKQSERSGEILERISAETYAGVSLPARLRALLAARRQATRKALDAEARGPSPATHAEVVRATERFLLVADAVVRGLGLKDARESARQLADVADDLATGLGQLQKDAADTRARGAARADAALIVLSEGGGQMLRLGMLGRDIGEIVAADLPRVQRARSAEDLVHAELAARDLAARLHQPDPSFGSRGGRGRAGGEAGSPAGGADDQGGMPDDVQQAFDQAAHDLDQLSQDHAGGMGNTEHALGQATSDQEMTQMRDEARRHAAAIRDAARGLPSVGRGGDSWSSKGATARELAEQTAESLEEGRLDEAAESGKVSLRSLEAAQRALKEGHGAEDPHGYDERRVDEARRKLDAEQAWVESELRELRKHASERAGAQLGQGGEDEEKLAERARELAQRGRGVLPDEAVDSIAEAERSARQAADALKRGDGQKGLEQQREAQRSLETARGQLNDEDDDDGKPSSSSEGGNGKSPHGHVDIPDAAKHKGPEEFRLRVQRGLAQSKSGSLKDAVQRYAEGLLR